MKQILYILLASTLLTACELETSNNGNLDGNWQLRQMDNLSTGDITDMSHSYIYWAFENKLMQLRDIDDGNLKILYRFDRQGNNLTIHDPYLVVTKDELEPITNTEILLPFGITAPEDLFIIEKLNGKHFTIKNELYRLHFRRY